MKNRFILFFEAVFYYIIYIVSGVVGNVLSIATMSVVIGLEYLSNNMLTNNTEFFEEVTTAVKSNVSLGVFFSLLFVLFAYWVAFKNRKRNLSEYAGLNRASLNGILTSAISGMLAYMLVTAFMEKYIMQTNIAQQYNEHIAWVGEGSLFITFFVIALLAPVVEEIVFRGVLITSFQKVITPIGALILTSFLFSVAHGNLVQGMYSFVLGIVLAYIRIKSKSLWNSIAMHISFNCSNIIFYALGINPGFLPVSITLALFVLFVFLAGNTSKMEKI